MTDSAAEQLDKRAVAMHFDRAAPAYDEHDFVQREVAERALERLDYVKLTPAVIADLGSGTGRCSRLLQARYRKATLLQCDFSSAMLVQARARQPRVFSRHRFVCADIEHLPLPADAVDLAVANLSLQWCTDLPGVLAEVHRVLRPGGLFLFTTLGPDTLRELREAWAAVSASPRVNRFIDMHDVGDALVSAGFTEPVLETDRLTVRYADAYAVMRDLKGIGAVNAAPARARGLTGRQTLAKVVAAYEAFRDDGRLPATYEVVYAHAWATDAMPRTEDGAQVFPLSRLRRR